MTKLVCAAFAFCLAIKGQNVAVVNPAALVAGGAAQTISVYNPQSPAVQTALWNGSPRVTTASTGFGGYTVQLKAGDLALSQVAELRLVDPSTGATLGRAYVPVVLGITPTGIAYDATRNVVYVATPQQTSDARFPVNSVVAFDPAAQKVTAVATMTGALANLALSDDSSALYVINEAEGSVHKLNPATLAEVSRFSFRPPVASVFTPRDFITVIPGQDGSVVLAYAPDLTSSAVTIAIFDGGTPRPSKRGTNCCDFTQPSAPSLLISPDGKYLFLDGITNAAGTINGLGRYSLDATGLVANAAPAVAVGAGAVLISGGLLYTQGYYTAGASAIDYASMTVVHNAGSAGPLTLDAARRRIYILYSPPFNNSGGTGPPVELLAYDRDTFEPLGSQAVGVGATTKLKASELLTRFGEDGMMLASSAGLLIFHTPLAGTAPSTSSNAVVNAASQTGGPISPGEIVTIYGSNLGPANAQAAALSPQGTFPTSLANVQVLFGKTAAPMLLSYAGQLNVVAPVSLIPGQTVQMQVLYGGIPSQQIALNVAPAAPGIFTRDGSGRGRVSIINADGTINTASAAGAIATIFGTGAGFIAGATDGSIARQATTISGGARVTIGGKDASVLYGGAAPGIVNGVFQINFAIPAGVASGLQSISVTIGGQTSPQGAQIEIR